MSRSYWLKMVGAARSPLDDNWLEKSPELLRGVRAPYKPTGIRRDDRMIYYSAGSQKVFAIARARDDGEAARMVHAAGEEDWPYVLDVQLLLAVPTLPLAPGWDVLELDSKSVQQKSYIRISIDTYRLGWEAIVGHTKV